ncbi:SDR family NAD(P)-dependent oxidoreductase [Oceanotoga teriensis]|jgi:NAD(P)-dependent dehydrogenase (short-subunit alcohol dehydrogenase family)|uniref:SDR family NAD(P)-dependent oxidoreductase n=1 Tax=Oceanotoga teriensis TaxID=515440 RepID=UPI002713813C|nr:SDR family oxidoreductase [Oceanotoga teriensis]MDO7977839.1 SDR family oxidoreductase [Oceanotoga teriensis]
MRLKDKVIIITGASSGIGEGIAKRFIEEGAKIVGCGIEENLNFKHDNAIYVKANLTKFEEAQNVVNKALEKFGKINGLVNCAGITLIGSLETSSVEDFSKQLDVNVKGVFHMCKAAIKELKKQKNSAIVNIGSDLGVRPIPERIGYCPSKAAVIMLTKCIAAEYAPNVRANCLLPGLVETPMIKFRFEESEDPDALRAEYAKIYPMNRMGTLEDMANTALFLISEESSFITGEKIGVCGGSLI